jgi:hypothetical protein
MYSTGSSLPDLLITSRSPSHSGLCHFKITLFTPLQWAHQILSSFGFPNFPYSSCKHSPLSVWPMSNNITAFVLGQKHIKWRNVSIELIWVSGVEMCSVNGIWHWLKICRDLYGMSGVFRYSENMTLSRIPSVTHILLSGTCSWVSFNPGITTQPLIIQKNSYHTYFLGAQQKQCRHYYMREL